MEFQSLSSEMSFSNLNMHFIYYIKNKINNYTYVGMTYNANKRFSQHLSALQENEHINKKLQRDFNSYGQDNFSAGIIDIIPTKEKAIDREKEIIQSLIKVNVLYNEVLYANHNKENDLNDPATLRNFILKRIEDGKGKEEIRNLILSFGISKIKMNNAFTKLNCTPSYNKEEKLMMQKFYLHYDHSEQNETDGSGIMKMFRNLLSEREDGFFNPDRKKFISGLEDLIKKLTFSDKQLRRLENELDKHYV